MRGVAGLVLVGGVLGTVGYLIACGYLALPGGWTVNYAGVRGDPVSDAALRRQVRLPPGFSIGVYAGGIANARFLLFTEAGDLLVSAPRQGEVVLVRRDPDRDGIADGQRVLLDGLDRPHGLAYRNGWLYVAETTAMLRVRFDPATGTVRGAAERIIPRLPEDGMHWTRTVHIGPDGKLYVSVDFTDIG
jgi:glucose/arabinose dehydrogenase